MLRNNPQNPAIERTLDGHECSGVGRGSQLRNVLEQGNIGSTVWADTAYRSKTNEAWLEKNGYVCDIHHKKPKGGR